MAQNSTIARRFDTLFKKAMTDNEGDREKSMKQKEHDYYDLTFFLHGLSKKDDVQTCLDEYLKLYVNYSQTDRRSKFVFAILLEKRIDLSKDDDKFVDELSDILADNQRPYRSPIKQRYEDLEQKEKASIQASLKYKQTLKKQRTGMLDLLKDSFFKKFNKKPAPQELLDFDPAPGSELEAKFNSLRTRCRDPWGRNDAEQIDGGLKDFISFLSTQKDPLKLFQILKWTRDIVTDRPYRVVTTKSGGTQTHRRSHDQLDCELYFQTAYWIFRYAVRNVYTKNLEGFTGEERNFFFDPLAPDYYYRNYINRYYTGIKKANKFEDSSVLFLRLLMFARINGATLANDKETSAVVDVLTDKSSKDELRKDSFYLGVGRELFRGNIRIGDKMGRARVIYFYEVKNNDEQFIFVEFSEVQNVLFKVSVSKLAQLNEDGFYTTLWENTRHLLVLIPALYTLLGYTVTLVTGGLFALAKEVVQDVVIGEVVEHVDAGAGSTGISTVVGIGTMFFRKGKLDVGQMDRYVNKGLKSLADDESRALKATAKMTSDEAKAIKSAQKYVGDEVKAVKTAEAVTTDDAKAAAATNRAKLGTDAHPDNRLAASGDTLKNKGSGAKRVEGGGGGAGGGGAGGGGAGGGGAGGGPPRSVPQTGYVMDLHNAELLADDLRQRSPWIQDLGRISNIGDRAARASELEEFIALYSDGTGIRIELVPDAEGQLLNNLGVTGLNWGTYREAEGVIYMRASVMDQIDAVNEIGHEVGAAELYRVYNLPKEMIPRVSGLRGVGGDSLTHYLDARFMNSMH